MCFFSIHSIYGGIAPSELLIGNFSISTISATVIVETVRWQKQRFPYTDSISCIRFHIPAVDAHVLKIEKSFSHHVHVKTRNQGTINGMGHGWILSCKPVMLRRLEMAWNSYNFLQLTICEFVWITWWGQFARKTSIALNNNVSTWNTTTYYFAVSQLSVVDIQNLCKYMLNAVFNVKFCISSGSIHQTISTARLPYPTD